MQPANSGDGAAHATTLVAALASALVARYRRDTRRRRAPRGTSRGASEGDAADSADRDELDAGGGDDDDDDGDQARRGGRAAAARHRQRCGARSATTTPTTSTTTTTMTTIRNAILKATSLVRAYRLTARARHRPNRNPQTRTRRVPAATSGRARSACRDAPAPAPSRLRRAASADARNTARGATNRRRPTKRWRCRPVRIGACVRARQHEPAQRNVKEERHVRRPVDRRGVLPRDIREHPEPARARQRRPSRAPRRT